MNIPDPGNHKRTPAWVRIGDGVALAVMALVLAGTFFTYGYFDVGMSRVLAFAGCALLGTWAGIGFVAGRWSDPGLRPARIALYTLLFLLGWVGIQLIPLPVAIVESLHPVWRESLAAMRLADVPIPDRLTLAPTPELAWLTWSQLLASILFYSSAAMIATRRRGAFWIIAMICTFSIIEGTVGLAHYTLLRAERAYGAIYNPNHHAAFVLMGLPLSLVSISEIRRRRLRRNGGYMSMAESLQDVSIFLFGLLLLALMGWLTSLSRGSVLLGGAVLAGFAVHEYTIARNKTPRRVADEEDEEEKPRLLARMSPTPRIIVALLLAIAFVALAYFGAVSQGFRSRFDFKGDGLGIDRPELWRATMMGLAQSPIFGVGPGGVEYTIVRNVRYPTTTNPKESHNDWVQFLGEYGVPASIVTICFAVFLVMALRRDMRRDAQAFPARSRTFRRAAFAGVLTALVHAAVDFHLRLASVGFLFLATTAVALTPGSLYILPRRHRLNEEFDEEDDDEE